MIREDSGDRIYHIA